MPKAFVKEKINWKKEQRDKQSQMWGEFMKQTRFGKQTIN
jgi:hypothetical protein